jgi:branched-chain amino acid transport system substrate-binding protein
VRLRRLAAAGLIPAIGLVAAACGSTSSPSTSNSAATSKSRGGQQVTIYSSQPLQGASHGQAQGLINGEEMALQEHGGKGGACSVKYVPMDDSTAAAGQWDPGAVEQNARRAATDPTTIAYLGEYNSPGTEISLPILNQVPILQVSPGNTYVGLTESAGALPGEPQKYNPSGEHTYGRIVPNDGVQAAAVVQLLKQNHVKKVYILNDSEAYGAGLARNVAQGARAAGIAVAANQRVDQRASNYRGVAQAISSSGADAFFYGGNTYAGAVELWKDVYAANPHLLMVGPDGVAESSFFTQVGAAGTNTLITDSELPPSEYPPAAKKFFQDYQTKYGIKPETYTIYGYEVMNVVLDAMSRAANCANRQDVIKAFFQTENRQSVLGTYSIKPDGDSTLTRYGVYRIKNNQLVFDETVQPAA